MMAEAQVIGAIGGQLIQVVATDKLAEANRKAAQDKDYANSQEYKDLQAMWGTGGTFQKAATAATAALQGLAGNNLNAAIAGAAAPYLAGVVKDLTGDNKEANILAHAVVGAALAQFKGESAAAGALGAGSAPLVADYLRQTLYPGAQNLTEAQKQTVSVLTTVAAGLAGGLAGGGSAGVLTGMQAGKNEVENNYLTIENIEQKQARLAAATSLAEKQKIIKEYARISLDNQSKAYADLERSVMTNLVLEQEKTKLQNALAGPITPEVRAEIVRNIAEIDGIISFYAKSKEYLEPAILTAETALTLATLGKYALARFGTRTVAGAV